MYNTNIIVMYVFNIFNVLTTKLWDMEDKMLYPNCRKVMNPCVTEHWTQTLKDMISTER